jgi:sigma-B regulation protein RsbU (phosphoserine phosphatase)
LLDFTRARLGSGLSIHKAPVDLHQVAADSVAELAVAFPNCALRHERSGPGLCEADGQRIAQAVGNLVANAANHGAPGGPITVRTAGTEGTVRVSVHNEGRPIPPEVQARLFEPMVRGSDAVAQGVGLGLFIVREIARAHGGQVELQSSAEAGTSFTVVLPAT